MADPKITVGMKFGNYNDMKAKLGEQYIEVPVKTTKQNKLILSEESYAYKKEWFRENSGQVSLSDAEYGNASKSVFLQENENGSYDKRYKYTLSTDGFTYSRASAKEESDDKFTKIMTETQFALDKNNNGIVDEGEIFDRKK